MLSIDINCDMGESTHLWPYHIEQDHVLLSYVSSINLACGFHAGDPHTMHELVEAAITSGVAIGAHLGFEDRNNFGRTNVQLSPEKVYDLVLYQIGALDAFLKVMNSRLHHVKPHGALYNMSAKNATIARAIAQAVKEHDPNLVLFGLSGSHSVQEAQQLGLKTCSEVFADRTYQDDGSLTPRSQPNALIHNTKQAVTQTLQMIQQKTVNSVSGKEMPIIAETICIHGDNHEAVAFAKAINEALGK